MLSVGLIDKYPVIGTGLHVVLRDKFDDVMIHAQSNFEDFYRLFKKQKLHVLVLSFYEKSVELSHHIIQKCRKYFPSIPIIVFGEKIFSSQALTALKAGIKGYVSKQDKSSEIVNCIDAVLKGRHYLHPLIEKELFRQLQVTIKTEPPKLSQLTKQQFIIAKYLGSGMRTSQIAETLNLKPSTVSTVKATVFRKMQVNNVVELSNLVRNQ